VSIKFLALFLFVPGKEVRLLIRLGARFRGRFFFLAFEVRFWFRRRVLQGEHGIALRPGPVWVTVCLDEAGTCSLFGTLPDDLDLSDPPV
jgi:hypothetical protein